LFLIRFWQAWTNEANPRLGLYNTETEEWKFVFYPLDAPESVLGGWVGLSDITPIGAGNFLVVERDNQGEYLVFYSKVFIFLTQFLSQADQMQRSRKFTKCHWEITLWRTEQPLPRQ
jgi:hypothetical protein